MKLLTQRLSAKLFVLSSLMIGGTALAEIVVIPGSGNPQQVLLVLGEAFHKHQSLHSIVVPPSTGTAGALRDVEAGTALLGRVGRPLKADEAARGLNYIALGRDPVAFVGGAGVTVKGLSQAQIVDVYRGKITNWNDFGAKPGPIRAIGREVTDASRQAISRVIKPFENIMFGGEVKLAHLDPQMIELLDRYPTSLGFLNRSALAECKTKVVFLALDGVEPNAQNVESGRYPLWLEFGFVHKTGKLSPGAKAFLEFVRSPAGASILRAQGVLPATG